MNKPGDRVGAVMSADDEEVHLLGYGVYEGDHRDPRRPGWPPNPRIRLDDDRIVWGRECWWGAEEKIKAWIGKRKVVESQLDRELGPHD